MAFRPLLPATMLLAALSLPVLAQGPERQPWVRVQHTVFERPFPAADTIDVDLLYRIPGDRFVFARNQRTGDFIARGNLLVEFRNDLGTRVFRDFQSIEIRRQEQVRQQEDIPDYQGSLTFRLPPDEYRLLVELKDLESGQTALDRSKRYSIGELKGKPGILDHPLIAWRDTATGRIRPFNRGASMLFGSVGGVLLNVFLPDQPDSVTLKWTLRPAERSDAVGPSSGAVTLSRGSIVSPGNPLFPFGYGLIDTTSWGWSSIFLDLPLHTLEPALYTLALSASLDGSIIERTVSIPIVWENMPQSLSRFDIAVEALRYIASEDDINDMVGFMADGGRKVFKDFWKKKDPDPSTAYNEVQEEFYRRVDESILRFSSRGELDGFRTDRGRIFILFGTPTSMDRVFRPESGPREIWLYESLRKRFIFTDPSRTGQYALTQSEDL